MATAVGSGELRPSLELPEELSESESEPEEPLPLPLPLPLASSRVSSCSSEPILCDDSLSAYVNRVKSLPYAENKNLEM